MGKNAYLFTGQGAQYAGMGKDLYDKYKTFKKIYEEASEYLKTDLINLDGAELAKTQNTQPAIFTLSYGIFKLLQENNMHPDCAAGFSLGEITALAASEIISFLDALELIKVRGEVMRAACEHKPGSMYSIIGAEDSLVEEICADINGYVIPANYNCPGQIVISGEAEAAEAAVKIFAEKKIRTVKLNVAGAFHTKLMAYKQNDLTEFLKTKKYHPPEFELYLNLTGGRFPPEAYMNNKPFMIDYIPKQMSNPVKFRAELENIYNNGCGLFIEIGAGRVLSGFVKRTCENAEFINIQDSAALEAACAMFHVKQ
jgi:[acyl-carrier-protein] S-malonyltransferase